MTKMQDKHKRELIEVKLKRVNKSVFVVPYFNGFETTAMEKAKYKNATYDENGKLKLAPTFLFDFSQEQYVQAVKAIKDESGQIKEDLSAEDILSLPDSDLKLINKQIEEAWKDPEEAKEKKVSKS